jgi:hypothetical protein
MTYRATLLALALLSSSCRGSGAPPPDAGDIGPAPEALAVDAPGAAASRADPQDAGADDGGDEAAGADADAKEPATYLAYVAEVERRCKPKEPQMSTWGMVRDTEEYLGCHAAMLTASMANLDADAASPRGARPDPAGALRTRTVDAVCRFQAARLWDHGGTSMAGEQCHNQNAWCLEGPDLGLGFLVHAWVSGDARAAADHVRARAAGGRQVRGALPVWKRYATVARTTAPFAALTNPACPMMTRLVDADWIALERDLALVDDGPPRLAAALCGAWPELAGALGGPAACARALAAYEISFAAVDASSNDPVVTQTPDPPAADLPPPADADLLAEIRPLRERCDGGSSCLADARRAEAKSAGLPFADRMDRWAGEVCSLPGLFDALGLAGDTYHPSLARGGPDGRCTSTASLLQVYALRRLAAGGAAAFAAHLHGRTAWGQSVKDDVEEALRLLRAPCPERKGACSAGTPAERAKAADRLRRLLADAPPLAAEMCASGGLAAALGGSAPCAEEAERWLFSFGLNRLERR